MQTSSLEAHKEPQTFSGFFICLIALLLLGFAMVLRIEPSIMQQPLMIQFNLTPDFLDDLAVRYQISLIVIYLFAGYLVDFVGARNTLVVAALIAIIGNFIFAMANSLNTIWYARVLIGFAHPFIFLSLFVLGSQRLARKYFPFYVTLIFSVLLLTPKFIVNPLILFLNFSNWRMAAQVINLIGAFLTIALILTYFFTPKENNFHFASPKKLLAILCKPAVLAICAASLLGWTANTFFFNWGAIYLSTALHFPVHFAIGTIAHVFIYFILGAISLGLFISLFHKTYLVIAVSYLISAISFALFLYLHLSIFAISNLLLIAGFFNGAATLCYAKVYDYCSAETAGFTFGLVAFITTGGNTLFAFLLGSYLEPILQANPSSASVWILPLSFIPAALLLGTVLALLVRK